MEEDRTITFLNSNVPNLSIRFMLLRHNTGAQIDTTHPLKKGKKQEWNFSHLELLKKPKLIIQQEDSQQLIIKLSHFERLLNSKYTIIIYQYDDSVVVASQKGETVVNQSFLLLSQKANLSASR